MNRNKEDVRHERIIRGLQKLDDNRRCLNCGSLGPQYVCTSFSTFVCVACSGVHREFNHRVKSISLSKFSPEEIAALQAGGNQRALAMYFKHWDSRQLPVPDCRNPEKLRDFIKAIYADQLYAANKLPPLPKGDEHDIRRRSSYLTSHSFEERRPNLQREAHQRTRSEDRPEYADDRYSPPVRSMREILGDDLPSLRIEPTSQTAIGRPPSVSSATPSHQQSFPETSHYVKADTTGWATFDSTPAVPATSETGSWGGVVADTTSACPAQVDAFQSKDEFFQESGAPRLPEDLFAAPVFYSAAAPSFLHQQFVPEEVIDMQPGTTIRRKSINPFDLPEDSSSPTTAASNFAIQHPTGSSSAATMPDQAWLPAEFASWSPVNNIPQASRPGNPFC